MLAKFVVDSYAKSKPKATDIDDQPISNSQDDILVSTTAADPEVSFYSA